MKTRIAAVLCGLALLLTACQGGGSSPAVTSSMSAGGAPLTVGLTYVPDIQFAPFYVAQSRGYFADEGLDVTLRHHGSGESLFGALATGEEDVVNAGADEMLQARSQGVAATTFGLMYQRYPVVMIVPEDSPIASPQDLKGKTIGVPGPFGESWFGLLALLDDAGLAESDVQIEHIGFTTQAALMTDKVDAVMGFSNSDVVNFEAAEFPVRTLPIEDNPLKSVGVGALEGTVVDRATDLAGLRRALARAMADIAADPAAAVADSKKFMPATSGAGEDERAVRVLEATAALYGADPMALNPADWEPMAAFMAERGLLEVDVDPGDAVTDLSGATPNSD